MSNPNLSQSSIKFKFLYVHKLLLAKLIQYSPAPDATAEEFRVEVDSAALKDFGSGFSALYLCPMTKPTVRCQKLPMQQRRRNGHFR